MTAQPEITTAAERAETTPTAEAGQGEPLMTLTQLHGLLREAAAIERAQRPIIIRPAAEAFTPTHAPAAAQPVGLDLAHASFPAPVSAPPPETGPGWALIRHHTPTAPAWGVRLAYAGMALATLGSAGAAVTDGAPAAIGAVSTGLAGLVAGIARAVHEQNRENQQ